MDGFSGEIKLKSSQVGGEMEWNKAKWNFLKSGKLAWVNST